MQSFEFEKALMQKHFNNEHFLETYVYPKSKLISTITNLEQINFSPDGVYEVHIKGELKIKDISQAIEEKGTIEVKGTSFQVSSIFTITLADYGIVFDATEMLSTKIRKRLRLPLLVNTTHTLQNN